VSKKEIRREFKDEFHIEEITRECVHYKSVSPSQGLSLAETICVWGSDQLKIFVCKVHGQPKPFVCGVCGHLETIGCVGSW